MKVETLMNILEDIGPDREVFVAVPDWAVMGSARIPIGNANVPVRAASLVGDDVIIEMDIPGETGR